MNAPTTHARTTLATLPLSLPDPTGVVFVDGDPGWPAELARALRAGAAGIALVHPAPVDFADLLDEKSATIVVVDSRWASNPVTDLAEPAFRAAAVKGSRLECRVVMDPGCDFATALLDQLVLIRALLAPVTKVQVQHLSDRALHAEGLTDLPLAVDFSIVSTAALPASASLRLLTSDGKVELTIPSGDTAQPARLITVGPDGAVLAPTQYETGHRASLRRVCELQATRSADGMADLRRLHADVVTTTAAIGDHLAVQAPA
ncbi:hypothetical protein EV643_103336 [Kribbella sp. VKM Ac-2527]|uniref:Uncharacterized protein n=1 Tax=Kribbella caucasensis TaxID=2512215 RepID=A0A4R6KJV1_9ACTN|nr:hypothetical protein [Kribbella sp. VKM Ac-2527]TDO51597.1 hypothetical protein EV643_103336 [Kribbella sp. VKM Ac-2527]